MRSAEHPAPWRVSAIVPTYNRAQLLPETLERLLTQTEPPHEIIVVDDGSTDDTEAVLAGFGDHIRRTRIPNSGAPVARNAGAALATGDWLWFCDSDDLWRPEYLARCRAIAGTPPHPQLLFGNFTLVRDGAWEPGDKFATAPPGYWDALASRPAPFGAIIEDAMVGAVLAFQPVFHSTLMMTRALFRKVGGYDGRFARTGSEDFEFILRCMAHPPFGRVDEPLVGIRRHGGNFSGDQQRALVGEVQILRHARACHPAAAAHIDLIDAEITRRTLQALAAAYAADDFEAVRSLAGQVAQKDLGPVDRLKVLMAGLPLPVRAPAVAASRIPGRVRQAVR